MCFRIGRDDADVGASAGSRGAASHDVVVMMVCDGQVLFLAAGPASSDGSPQAITPYAWSDEEVDARPDRETGSATPFCKPDRKSVV